MNASYDKDQMPEKRAADAAAAFTPTEPEGRSPDQIESEIEETRHHLDDTLTALQRKFSLDGIADQVVSYVRGGDAAEFGRNLSEAVRRNPVPVALVGIGIAWLMASGREASYAPQNAQPSRMGERMGSLKQKLGDVGHRISETASAGRERLSSGGQKMASARGQLSEKAYGMRDQLSGTASSVRDQAAHLGSSARYQAQRARSGFQTVLREQPLLVGAVGVALGAALGALLPPTEQEDRLLGDARDRVASKARTELDRQMEKGKQVAQAAGEAAKDEARRQGESPGQSVRH